GSLVLIKERAVPEAPAPQDTAKIRGRVVDSNNGDPIAVASVSIRGTDRQVVTDARGSFTLTELSAGEHVLVVERLGYRPATVTLQLTAGQDTTIIVNLAAEPIALRGLVTTISGDRRRAEVGNSIVKIDAAQEVETHAFRDLSDLLAGRGNGLLVTPGGGSPNAPSRHRIRGLNSITGSNDPIVIIDGVRALTSYERCLNVTGSLH